MADSTIAVLQAVDGIANKTPADSSVAASPEEKVITFKVAEGIRFIEYGINSIFRIIRWAVALIFGITVLKTDKTELLIPKFNVMIYIHNSSILRC